MSESSDSAKRVKTFFSNSQNREDAEKSAKSHDYRLEQSPPLLQGIEGITLNPSMPTKRRLAKATVVEGKVPLEQLYCSANQNYPLDIIEKTEALQLRKVKSVRVKERFIAARELKKLSHEMQQWIYSQVHQKVEVLGKDHVDFYTLLEKREERHFQIDRIIKYLSN